MEDILHTALHIDAAIHVRLAGNHRHRREFRLRAIQLRQYLGVDLWSAVVRTAQLCVCGGYFEEGGVWSEEGE